MENLSISKVKEAVTEGRDAKERIKEKSIRRNGAFGEWLFEDVEAMVELLEEEWEPLLNTQYEKLKPYLAKESYEDVKEQFNKGIRPLVRGHYKLLLLDGHPELLKNTEYLENLILSYAFDFLRTLKVAQKNELSVKSGLHLAHLAYKNNPQLWGSLNQQFPEFPAWACVQAMKIAGSDPVVFLQNVRNEFTKMREIEKYAEFSDYVLQRTLVASSSNAYEKMDNLKSTLDTLRLDPDSSMLPPGAIMTMVFDSGGQEAKALEKLHSVIDVGRNLKNDIRFQDCPDYLINRVVIQSPNSAEQRLVSLLNTVKSLRERPEFSALNNNIITQTVALYSDPEDELKQIIDRVTRLKEDERFKDFSWAYYIVAATNYPTNPELWLLEIQEDLKRISEHPRYNKIPPYIVKPLVVRSRAKINENLENVLDGLENLRNNEEYKDLPEYFISYALAARPSSPETLLKKAVYNLQKLKEDQNFTGVHHYILHSAILRRPNNCQQYVRDILDKIVVLRSDSRFQEVSDAKLQRIVTYHFEKAEEHLLELIKKGIEADQETSVNEMIEEAILKEEQIPEKADNDDISELYEEQT